MDEGRLELIRSGSAEEICFFSLVRSGETDRHAQFLLKSLRTFGGALRDCPVVVFRTHGEGETRFDLEFENVREIPVDVDRELSSYWFGDKVFVSSLAEGTAEKHVRSLIWLSTGCLILQPPIQFDLEDRYHAAFRPVHIQNIGLSVEEPLDPFWNAIYDTVGIDECTYGIRTFVDSKEIRPYFNTHLFSIDPSKGILRTWLEHFREMISDQDFQTSVCVDQRHQIFLHQAILSVLIMKMLDRESVNILPLEYSYPLHLLQEVPPLLRPGSLNELVCPVYEGVYRHPETLNGLDVHEPLKSWIIDNMPAVKGV